MASETNERGYADLVSGLLGARTDPATERFDRELHEAVEHGEVSALVARQLRFWQRASLRALTDHTRTVLPTALGALEASRLDAEAYMGELLDALDAAHQGENGEPEVEPQVEPAPARAAEAVTTPDTPGPASTVTLPATISLERPRSRLLVAGLVTTTAAPDIRIENC